MKKIHLLFTALGIFISSFSVSLAQNGSPEKVYSILKIYHEHDWYVNQYQLWEAELQKNQKSEEAWQNVYTAARMAYIASADNAIREEWRNTSLDIVEKAKKKIGGTYTYYYISLWSQSVFEAKTENELKAFEELAEKAHALKPESPGVYPDLMNIYLLKNDREKMAELSKKWFASGDFSPSLLALNYNMLQCVEEDAILITVGDNDTYPAVVLQHAKNIGKSVTIINLPIALINETYRNNCLKTLNIPTLLGENIERNIFLQQLIQHKGEHSLYFSYGSQISTDEDYEPLLYNVGLAMKYSEEKINNNSLIIHHFENKFLLDHLKINLFQEDFPQETKRINLRYIPGMVQVWEHYCLTQQKQKQEEIEKIMTRLVSGTPYESSIMEIINQ